MKTSLETGKQLGIKRTVTHKVESTSGIYAKAQLCDSRTTQKAVVEAERKKAEAITILMRSQRIC